jgi:hypothetical protein
MPNHSVVGDLSIRNLSVEPRLHPCRVRLLQRFGQRRGGTRKRLKYVPDGPGGLAIPSSADAADVDQAAAFAAREAQL